MKVNIEFGPEDRGFDGKMDPWHKKIRDMFRKGHEERQLVRIPVEMRGDLIVLRVSPVVQSRDGGCMGGSVECEFDGITREVK